MSEIDTKMKRNSFIFYESFYSAVQTLTKSKRLLMYEAIIELALYDKEPTNLEGSLKGMFELISPQIKANTKKYRNGCKGGKFGERGGRPNNPLGVSTENPTKTPNENDNENENVNENDIILSSPAAPKSVKHKYGPHKNVLLTDDEYEKLKARYPDDYEAKINTLSKGMALKHYHYKSHYLAVIEWAENSKTESGTAPSFDIGLF